MHKLLRNITLVSLVVALTFIMAACGSNATTNPSGTNAGQNTSGNKDNAKDTKKYVMKIAHTSTPENVRNLGAEKVKEWVQEKTNGQVEVQIFPASQLGNDKDLIEGMQSGNVEMVILPVSPLGGFQPLVTMLDIPFFLPDNKDDLLKLYQSDAMRALLDTTEEVGVKTLAVWHTGYKQFTANKPLIQPEDYQGLKYRTQPSPILIETIKALGGSAVSIPFAETYSALQTGTVDSQGDNPLNTVYDMKFYEVQKNITMTNHGTLDMLAMVSKKWFDSLPEDIQKVVIEAANEASGAVVDKSYKISNKDMELMKEKGIKFHEITADQRRALQEKTKGVKDFYLKEYGDKAKQLLTPIEQAIQSLK